MGKVVAVGPPLIQTVQAFPMSFTPVVQAIPAPKQVKEVQIVEVPTAHVSTAALPRHAACSIVATACVHA